MPAQPDPQESELPVMDRPYAPPPQVGAQARFISLPLSAPWRWLVLGFGDLKASPGIGLFYGTVFWLMAQVLALVFRRSPEYTLSMVSGCLLVGPFLAMGLYEVSRRREQGLPQSLAASLTCWDGHIRSMSMLVLVLLVLELLWGRASLVVFAVFFSTGMPSTTGVIDAIFSPDNLSFVVVYLFVGGFFATLVYAISAVSIPMILDRDTDAISAGLTSVRVLFGELAVMLLWGLVLSLLVVLSFLSPWMLGLVMVGPWLGHASWHAYRGTVIWVEAEAPAEPHSRQLLN
ncbi:MAG: DUF2189 domain-containing protein [Limnohabitans sp.]